MTGLPLLLVADFVCPFSFVTEMGLRRVVGPAGAIRAIAFELYPDPVPLPAPGPDPAWLDALAPLARDVDVVIGSPAVVPRTRKAHEAACFAREHGFEAEMREAIYRGYWGEGLDIGRIDVLLELASRCGADPVALKIALDIDTHAEAVEQDRSAAERSGIHQTPTLILGSPPARSSVSGALSIRELDSLINQR